MCSAVVDESPGTQNKQIPDTLLLIDCCSVALAPGWHPRPGCKWCCCSGRCSLPDFLPWLCYNCRRGSLGLHPVYAVCDVKCAPEPYCAACFSGDNCWVLHRAIIQQSWAQGRLCVTRRSQSLRSTQLRSTTGASSSSAVRVRDEFGGAQSRCQGTHVQNTGDPPQTTG